MNSDSQRIKREEQLSRELQKTRGFISACGLSDDYQQFKYNSKTKKNVLE